MVKIGVISYDESIGSLLKDIPWKDINQKFKNDFDKTLDYILSSKSQEEKSLLDQFTNKVDLEIKELNLRLLGNKTKPPEGY